MNKEGLMTEQQARENLEFIRKVIDETRRAAVASNPLFYLWGVVTWVEVLLTYGFIYVTVGLQGPNLIAYIGWPWWILSAVATIYTIVYMVRQQRQKPLSTFSSRIVGSVWISCLAGIVLIVYIGAIAAQLHGYTIHFATIQPTVTVLLACALFIMGVSYELKVLKRLALAFWAGTTLMLLVPVIWAPLVYGVIVGTGLLITGAVLRRQAQAHYGG